MMVVESRRNATKGERMSATPTKTEEIYHGRGFTARETPQGTEVSFAVGIRKQDAPQVIADLKADGVSVEVLPGGHWEVLR